MLNSEDLFRNVYILAGKENIKEKFINTLVEIYFSDWFRKAWFQAIDKKIVL